MPEWIVAADAAGARLDKFLAAPGRLGSRAKAAAALERGKIFVNDEEASLRDAARLVADGDTVRLWEDRPGSSRPAARQPRGDLAIVYEDAAILVFNKPAGLLSVPLDGAHSAVDLLEDYLRSRTRRKPLVVHRIDRDTSGLVVFAKDLRSHAALKEQFRRREPERIYWAAVYGHPEPPSGTWRDYLVWDAKALIQKETSPRDPKAAEAIADYRVIERYSWGPASAGPAGGVTASLIEVSLQTGKRNQIRIQARLRGHTLIGEQRYVYGPPELRPIAFPRQALHAHRLAFNHPADGRRMEFEAPLPADFTDLLQQLRRRGGRL